MISVIGIFAVAATGNGRQIEGFNRAPRAYSSLLVEPVSGGMLGSLGQVRLT